MRIEELINNYFEGETSASEEEELRTFFASSDVPPHLSDYKPLFAYIKQEREAMREETSPVRKNKRISLRLLSGVAAALLLILGIRGVYTTYETRYCSENYVVINGRCYTDMKKVRDMALEALKEVATPANEYFPDQSDHTLEKEVFEMQLRELGSLFNEE